MYEYKAKKFEIYSSRVDKWVKIFTKYNDAVSTVVPWFSDIQQTFINKNIIAFVSALYYFMTANITSSYVIDAL